MHIHGKARVNPTAPQGFALCDRCGVPNNLVNLRYQYQWRGTTLQNTRFKVCPRCYDVPSEFLRTIFLPPDPMPLIDPRPIPYAFWEDDLMAMENGSVFAAENGELMSPEGASTSYD